METSAQKTAVEFAQFKKMKYGFFVHYVWGGKWGIINSSGVQTASFDECANAFDVARFADDLLAWGVEYVIFTAWHFNINPLYPSAVMQKWGLDAHVCKRDLVGDMIQAVKAKGIGVLLYTHPRDGHDVSLEDQVKTGWGGPNGIHPDWDKFDFQKWNDFTNELYAELIDRYGKDILGLYLDEGSGDGDSYKVVDYPRLRETIKSRNPNLIMIQNYYGTVYTCDIGDKEYHFWGEFESRDGSVWPAYKMPVGTCFAATWMAKEPAGTNTVKFSAEDMFRYTVLQAGANTDGGGVQWATGPYAGGGWETGVDETMKKLGGYVAAVAESIKGTYPSASFVTEPGATTGSVAWGVATRSTDDRFEYIHVLKHPAGTTLQLPPPADGKQFKSAHLLVTRQEIKLRQDAQGLSLTLPSGAKWDDLDTVIKLERL